MCWIWIEWTACKAFLNSSNKLIITQRFEITAWFSNLQYMHKKTYVHKTAYLLACFNWFFFSLTGKIPFCGRLLKTHDRPRLVLSSPFLLPRAHPVKLQEKNNNKWAKFSPKHLAWHWQCGSEKQTNKKKAAARDDAACRVRTHTNTRYERVAPQGNSSLWPSCHLAEPAPLSCLLISVSPSLSAPFTRPSLFLFVQREGDRRPFPFYLLWLQCVL